MDLCIIIFVQKVDIAVPLKGGNIVIEIKCVDLSTYTDPKSAKSKRSLSKSR